MYGMHYYILWHTYVHTSIYISYYIDTENITSQLQCISASAAGMSAILVIDE